MATKSVEDQVSANVSNFLERIMKRYFRNPSDARHPYNQTEAAHALRLSQGHISDLMARKPGKKAGLMVVLRLREATGASFEEITGHRLTRVPRYRIDDPSRSELDSAEAAAEAARHEEGRGAGHRPSESVRIGRPRSKP